VTDQQPTAVLLDRRHRSCIRVGPAYCIGGTWTFTSPRKTLFYGVGSETQAKRSAYSQRRLYRLPIEEVRQTGDQVAVKIERGRQITRIGPARYVADQWVFDPRYRPTLTETEIGTKRAITMWKNRINTDRVVEVDPSR